MKNNRFTVIDLFCGTGGFAQGFVDCDRLYDLIYAIDSDPVAAATARANHGRCIVDTRDIRKVSPEAISEALRVKTVDVVIGGPPCQGFSSLRPHRSSLVDDERNDLYTRFVSFVGHFRPTAVVLENVVGLLTHRSGHTLDAILNQFAALGYRVDWRILNAANFGVPQKRERFIMIAARDNAAVRFPAPSHHFDGRVIGHKDRSRHLVGARDLPKAISVNNAIGDLPRLTRGQEAHHYDQPPTHAYQRSRRVGSKSLTLHRAARHNDKMMEVIKHAGESISCIPRHLITSGFSSCYSRLQGDEPSTTITVKFQSPASNKCIHPVQDRTLTPREAARIQSFDDSFVFVGSHTQVAAQIGNAVPPLLGRAIAGAIAGMLA